MAEEAHEDNWKAANLPSPRGTPPPGIPPQPISVPSGAPPPGPKTTARKKARKARAQPRKANVDGAVSDSVVNHASGPQVTASQKPRQQSTTLPAQPAQPAKQNIQKQRPVSVGGNMLPATPLKEQAYAGPTFQASPAASALPMPKFFSKSVPSVAKHSASLDARTAGQKTPEKSSSEPDVVLPQPPPRSAQQSPLDLFFNAQKAEKQRKASEQSPEKKQNQQLPATEPRNPFQQSGKSVFLREMDGDSDAMPSPRTVPPQRSDRDAYTQSLKDLLFKGIDSSTSQHTSPPQTQRSPSHLQRPQQPFLTPSLTPSPSQRSTSGPSTPTPTAEQQNNNYALHYGNRNLSPLFQAARGDTPSRPSNLRQYSSASDSSPITSNNQRPVSQNDARTFSRSYLDQHIRDSPPATMPDIPAPKGFSAQGPHHSSSPAPQYGAGLGGGTGASPRTANNGGRDIRSMENDLRRILKVNVLGN